MSFFDWFTRRKLLHRNIDREIELNELYKYALKESYKEKIKLAKELDVYRYTKERLYPVDELLDEINAFKENLEARIRTLNSIQKTKKNEE